MADDIQIEGTIHFRMQHHHHDWASNKLGYNFTPVEHGPIRAQAKKRPDGSVVIEIAGPFGGTYDFHEPIPKVAPDGLTVGLTWADNKVKLFLDGKWVETRSSPRTLH